MNRESALEAVRSAHEQIFNFLMDNILTPYWSILKRHDNRLFNIECKLIKLNTDDMNIIREAHQKAEEAKSALATAKSEMHKTMAKNEVLTIN